MPGFGMLHSRDWVKISLKPELVPKWSFYAKSTKLLFSINTRKIFDLYLFLVVFNPNSLWTVLKQLGFLGWKLSLPAIIAWNVIKIKYVALILAWIIFKVRKNCFKVGKIMILCSNFGKFWKSASLQAVAHQNLQKHSLVCMYALGKKI